MPTSVVLGAAALGASLPLLWWSVAAGRKPSKGGLWRRMTKRGESTSDMRELELAQSAGSRVVKPLLKSITHRVRRVTPSGWVDAIQEKITLAGAEVRWPVEKLVAVKVLLAAGTVLLGVLLIRMRPTVPNLVTAGLLAFVGLFGPGIVLDRRIRERQEAIERELPDALDQITMGVEAGLGFEAAMSRAARAGRGAVSEEFTRVIKEMHIGISRSEALRALTKRSTVPDLHAFVVAVVQAEHYGLPIAQVLRVQAAELRIKRRQRAEERALRMPVKLIFPLGLCIFPALFIVVLGPGAIRIWRALS